jgi:hypothetical protein
VERLQFPTRPALFQLKGHAAVPVISGTAGIRRSVENSCTTNGYTGNRVCAIGSAGEGMQDSERLCLGYVGKNRKGKREAEEKSDPASGLAHGKLLIPSEQALERGHDCSSNRQK